MYTITHGLKPGLRDVRCKKKQKKNSRKALVTSREVAWFETDTAIKYLLFSVICFPAVGMRFTKMVSRSKGGKIHGETVNIYLETEER